MATTRKTSTKPADTAVAVEESVATAADAVVNEASNVNTENDTAKVKEAEKTIERELPLSDSDEIEVVSMIRNVDYLDSYTGDRYQWVEVGQVEYMSFEALKGMWRKHKTYFRNMWLRPNDDRVIKKFGLESIYKKYDFLMDGSNYTVKNIEKINDAVSSAPKDLKLSIRSKIKEMVDCGEIVDINVIRKLEESLNLELINR